MKFQYLKTAVSFDCCVRTKGTAPYKRLEIIRMDYVGSVRLVYYRFGGFVRVGLD